MAPDPLLLRVADGCRRVGSLAGFVDGKPTLAVATLSVVSDRAGPYFTGADPVAARNERPPPLVRNSFQNRLLILGTNNLRRVLGNLDSWKLRDLIECKFTSPS